MLTTTTGLSAACVPSSFSGLAVFGAELVSVNTALVTNYSASVPPGPRLTQPPIEVRNATFCNVTVTYTHPGQGDNIIVETWLPIENPTWNDRLQAAGGGGWAAGRFATMYMTMQGALGDGYATTTTDAGLGYSEDPTDWALASPGNVDWYKFNNFGSVSLNDQAIISKSLIKSFYGTGPVFSYWNGCSQGGRQGVMLAQRYPDAYDGISVGAPALYISRLCPAVFWPQQVMNMRGEYPYRCEMDAITAAAVTACDGLDGLVDGLISDPDLCLAKFDPRPLVGTPVPHCQQAGNRTVEISAAAVAVANATWHGVVSASGARTWYGLGPGSDISTDPGAVAATNCTSGTCIGSPQPVSLGWIVPFLGKGAPNFDISRLTHAEFDKLMHIGRQIYRSAIDTDDPDLSEFRDAGGKMVSFHGLWDTIVPPQNTRHYYNQVAAVLPDVHDFYRHYEVPGLAHCYGSVSGQPTSLFDQLRAWVENGTAPEETPVNVTVSDGGTQQRILCPYPQRYNYDQKRCRGHGHADASCWVCTAGPADEGLITP
ncbi:Tannase/feruloyl esterase [Chaetomidium leptoderma]|uniref:Carboxylic ester hydrolase n=1 Tax=Chaetomidium leptoderma TaxID=669021 RepID=A0AAN6VNX9_9PEZI|nr:Tannase/feruloyl esterase [Chaetomidium leptoderma]